MSDDEYYPPLFDDSVKNSEIEARVRAWIDALRGDKYQQGEGELRVPSKNVSEPDLDVDGFCCLGVLCDLENPNAWTLMPPADEYSESHYEWDWKDRPEADNEHYVAMPPEDLLRRRYGMPQGAKFGDHTSLDELNDNGHSFAEIANVIEAELVDALARETAS